MRLENETLGDKNPVGLRLPSALKAKIKEAAKQNKHSMNAEIVTRLEKSFSDDESEDHKIYVSDDQMAFFIKAITEKLVTDRIISTEE